MRRFLRISLGLLAIASRTLPAQSDGSCASRLAGPAADSVMVTFGATVVSFDDKRPLPASYASLLAEGIREQLRLPSPLLFTAYQAERTDTNKSTRTFRALPALSALYGITLDGAHFRNVRFLTGTASPGFDLAVRNALAALDSTGDLPPLPDSANAGPLELRVVIARDYPARQAAPSDVASPTVPLFRAHVPARAVTQTVGPRRGVVFEPLIPRSFRPNASGSILIEMRVGETGDVDPVSVRILSFSSLDLVQAVFPRIAQMKFQPLIVEGCPVTALEAIGASYESTPVRVR